MSVRSLSNLLYASWLGNTPNSHRFSFVTLGSLRVDSGIPVLHPIVAGVGRVFLVVPAVVNGVLRVVVLGKDLRPLIDVVGHGGLVIGGTLLNRLHNDNLIC